MNPGISIQYNHFPLGWEWLQRVPIEDFKWLLEIFATVTDNTDIYECVLEQGDKIIEINTLELARFMEEDQGITGGIREHSIYVACKALNITSEDEYMERIDEIWKLCNIDTDNEVYIPESESDDKWEDYLITNPTKEY